MLREPGTYFKELPHEMGLKQPLGFLVVSSVFFMGASLVRTLPLNPIFWGAVFLINATGMVFIAAGLGYMVMAIIMGKRVTFKRFLSIYAFSSGVTLLASWVPLFFWLTEPWKWWLIGIGMVKSFGFKLPQVFLIVGISVSIMVLFFGSVLPIILHR